MSHEGAMSVNSVAVHGPPTREEPVQPLARPSACIAPVTDVYCVQNAVELAVFCTQVYADR